jgi:hypothetical protein
MSFEYKTVAAPEKGKRMRGLHNASERVAAAFDAILQTEAVDGWEYLRTDLLPVTERSGWFARPREMHRAVMVFRRALATAAPDEDDAVLLQAPTAAQPAAPAARAEPEVAIDPDLRLADTVRGPGEPEPKG